MDTEKTIKRTFRKLLPGKTAAQTATKPAKNAIQDEQLKIPAKRLPKNAASTIKRQRPTPKVVFELDIKFEAMSPAEFKTYADAQIAKMGHKFSHSKDIPIPGTPSRKPQRYSAFTPTSTYTRSYSIPYEMGTLLGTPNQRPPPCNFVPLELRCSDKTCAMHVAGRTARQTLGLAKTRLCSEYRELIAKEKDAGYKETLEKLLAAVEPDVGRLLSEVELDDSDSKSDDDAVVVVVIKKTVVEEMDEWREMMKKKVGEVERVPASLPGLAARATDMLTSPARRISESERGSEEKHEKSRQDLVALEAQYEDEGYGSDWDDLED